jgi:hypothetical protein
MVEQSGKMTFWTWKLCIIGFIFPHIKQEQIRAKIGPWANNKPKLIKTPKSWLKPYL